MIANASKLELYQAIQAAREMAFLPIVTIYDRPSDHPDGFIARLFVAGNVEIPTLITVTGSLEDIQDKLMEVGLTKMNRATEDDPKIVEIWL